MLSRKGIDYTFHLKSSGVNSTTRLAAEKCLSQKRMHASETNADP